MPQERLTAKQLGAFLDDLKWHTEWRALADKDVAYYDGRQLDNDVLNAMRDRGLAPLVRNYVRPTIDFVLGMEAKNKRDWKVVADSEMDVKTAEALSAKLKGVERASLADRACSDAYASMIKAGIGWAEVGRESDPFKSPIRVTSPHRNEMYWDWRATMPDLSDARYIMRRKWFDIDTLRNWFPEKRRLINMAMSDLADFDPHFFSEDLGTELSRDFNEGFDTSISHSEWRDSDRERLRLYEVWYKVWTTGFIFRLPDGSVIEYDPTNFKHAQLVAAGIVRPEFIRYLKPRQTFWVGPHQLTDNPSPYPFRDFPFVAFIASREDGKGGPIGLIRHMRSPQDEINSRLSKMIWLLSAKRIIADEDSSFRPWKEVVAQAGRPDSLILLNPNRQNRNSDAFRVESDFQLSAQQFQVMQEATRAIQDVAGVYQAQLGKESAADSGVAINSLVEQGSTTLAEMNDNYRYSRTRVGELVLALVREDVGNEQEQIGVTRNGRRVTITLNQREGTPDGDYIMTNSVAHARLHLELEDIPQTPTYRQQQFTMLTEIVKSLPPDVMPLFADFMVASSDLKDKEELVRRIQDQFGTRKPADEMTPEEQQAAQAEAQAAQEAQALAIEEQRQKVDKLAAEIEQLIAKTRNLDAQTEQISQETVLDVDERIATIAKNEDAPTERERFNREVNAANGPKSNNTRA